MTALVLFAHGSRDAQWAEPFRSVQRRVAARRPDLTVELAFLELMQPALPDLIDRLAEHHGRITIAPLFMGQGAHLRRDLAELIASIGCRHARLELTVLPASGEAEPVLDALTAWLADAA